MNQVYSYRARWVSTEKRASNDRCIAGDKPSSRHLSVRCATGLLPNRRRAAQNVLAVANALVCSIRYRVRTFERYCHQAVRPSGIIFAVIRMRGDFMQPRLGQMEGNFAYCPAPHDEIILCPCVRLASFEVEALPNAQLA